MANVRKVVGKNETAYKITVSIGRTKDGKQQRHYKTFVAPEGMSERRAAKEAEKIAFQFEEELRLSFQPDNRITFAEYDDYFMQTRRRTGLKRSTFERYQALLTRINAAIGHMRLQDIRPQHLNLLYENLMEDGIRQQPATAVSKTTFQSRLTSWELASKSCRDERRLPPRPSAKREEAIPFNGRKQKHLLKR